VGTKFVTLNVQAGSNVHIATLSII